MSCRVLPSGQVYGCLVYAETPEGEGFGDAALKLAHLFQMHPRGEPEPVGGNVIIPVTFRP